MKTIAFLLIFAACHFCHGAAETNCISVGGWSKPVSDFYGYALRGRLLLRQVPWRGPSNTPDVGVYLELEEVSDFMAVPMEVFCDLLSTNRADGLHCELHYSDGQPVAGGMVFSGGGPGSCWITMPSFSTMRLRVSMDNTAKSKRGIPIYLTRESWIIPPGTTNDCFLSGAFRVNPPADLVTPYTPSNHHVWKGTLALPPLRIPVKTLSE
jgi:hypothetical protein